MNIKITKNTSDMQAQQTLFNQLINEVENNYHLYFGLKSIQKGLVQPERIHDHYNFDCETCVFCFREESDLPQEIREIVFQTYCRVFKSAK